MMTEDQKTEIKIIAGLIIFAIVAMTVVAIVATVYSEENKCHCAEQTTVKNKFKE